MDDLRGRIVPVLMLLLPNLAQMLSGRQRIQRVLLRCGGADLPSSLNSSSFVAQNQAEVLSRMCVLGRLLA